MLNMPFLALFEACAVGQSMLRMPLPVQLAPHRGPTFTLPTLSGQREPATERRERAAYQPWPPADYPDGVTVWRGVFGVVVLFGLGCLLGWTFSWGVVASGFSLAAIAVVAVVANSWRSAGSQEVG